MLLATTISGLCLLSAAGAVGLLTSGVTLLVDDLTLKRLVIKTQLAQYCINKRLTGILRVKYRTVITIDLKSSLNTPVNHVVINRCIKRIRWNQRYVPDNCMR